VFPGLGLLVKSFTLSALIIGDASNEIARWKVAGHGASISRHRSLSESCGRTSSQATTDGLDSALKFTRTVDSFDTPIDELSISLSFGVVCSVIVA